MFNTELLNLMGASEATAHTSFDFPDQQVVIAERGLRGLAKFDKLAGQRHIYFAYLANLATAMANHSVMYKAKAELDTIVALVERNDEAQGQKSHNVSATDAVEAEIATSFKRLEYCASKSISAELDEDISAYPDQYRIYLSDEKASIQIRIAGNVGWSDQCFPKSAKLEFKLDCSPLWSTYPTTNPENAALLAFAHFHVNHA